RPAVRYLHAGGARDERRLRARGLRRPGGADDGRATGDAVPGAEGIDEAAVVGDRAPRSAVRRRQARRNLPLAATTGRFGSSCQATARTLAMRRPSLKISARARVGSGPAERR